MKPTSKSPENKTKTLNQSALSLLALASLFCLTNCETYDDDDHDHRHNRGTTTTTTTKNENASKQNSLRNLKKKISKNIYSIFHYYV